MSQRWRRTWCLTPYPKPLSRQVYVHNAIKLGLSLALDLGPLVAEGGGESSPAAAAAPPSVEPGAVVEDTGVKLIR